MRGTLKEKAKHGRDVEELKQKIMHYCKNICGKEFEIVYKSIIRGVQ